MLKRNSLRGPPVSFAMRPNLHPRLVNGRFGDPALFVEGLHSRDAILFDCGDLAALSPRDLLRVTHLFVTHMHMDHFIGFDTLLRVHVGRAKTIRVAGPPGIIERVAHKLGGYAWDLAHRYDADLVFEVRELGDGRPAPRARFRFKRAFAREDLAVPDPGPIDAGAGLVVRHAVLEHHGPCLGYALAEQVHANVWKTRLAERNLAPGPWLQRLKRAVMEGAPGDQLVALPDGTAQPLAALSELVSLSPGQVVAYVTDVADTQENRRRIVALAHGADLLFLEARFAGADAAQARDRAHLTTLACGEIARSAGVRRLEPFHFSPRYQDEEERMLQEVATAFAGADDAASALAR